MKHTLRLLLCLVVATMASANIFAAVGDIFTANVGGVDMRFIVLASGKVGVYGTSTTNISIDKTTAGSITVPATVEYLGDTYQVTEIRQYAFYGCSNITDVTVGENVQYIRMNAFQGCTSLTSITLDDALLNIAKNTFKGCTGLTQIAIPASVNTLGDGVFNGCSNITRVDITDVAAWCGINFVAIDSSPLQNGNAELYLNGALLEDLIIPSGVTSIRNFAFNYAKNILTVTIPATVTSIGNRTFDNCTGITDIYCEGNTPATLGTEAFGQYSVDPYYRAIFHTSFEALASYLSATGWSDNMKYRTSLDETTLPSDYAYTNTDGFTVEKKNIAIEYSRNFKNGNWQPLFLPCRVKSEDILADYDILAVLDDQTDAGNAIKVAEVTGGFLRPGRPYMIRAKVFDPASPKQTMTFATNRFVTCNSNTFTPTESGWTFHGVYTETVGLKTNGGWAMNGGKLSRPSSDAVKLLPFRWYVVSNGSSSVREESSISLDIIEGGYVEFDDDDVDGIEQLSSVDLAKSNIWYTLDGQRIARPTKKGLYIKNGKKVLF